MPMAAAATEASPEAAGSSAESAGCEGCGSGSGSGLEVRVRVKLRVRVGFWVKG